MRKFLLGCALLFTGVAPLQSALFYVDFASGSNSNNGMSTASPWKHCPGDPAASGVPAATNLSPGDVVHFRGDVTYVFTGETGIALKWDGVPDNPIIYDGNSKGQWGTGRARFTDNYGSHAITAFSSNALRRHLSFRALEFRRIGGAPVLPLDLGLPLVPRFGGGIGFPAGAENVTVDNCVFQELGYWLNQRPMNAHSLAGTGVSASPARNFKVTNCQFSRVAIAIDFADATDLTNVAIASSTFEQAIVWPMRLPVGASAASTTSLSFTNCTTAADATFSAGTWRGYGYEPQTQVAAVAAGVSATLYASAVATPTPRYEWRKNGIPIAGVSGSSLHLPRISISDAGIYSAVAINAGGSAPSNLAVLIVNGVNGGPPLDPVDGISGDLAAPVIALQPVQQVVATGGNATFAAAVIGTPTPTLQWQKNGVNIPGATSSTLSLFNVSTADAASYRVVATNSSGTVASAAATLTLTGDSVARPVFTTQPNSMTVNPGMTVALRAAATGSPAPSYQWRKNGVAIAGATNDYLVLRLVTASDSATYTVVASNAAGSTVSTGAEFTVSGPPVFAVQPVSHFVNSWTTVVFTSAATGSPAPSYQWRRNGIDIVGATAPTLTLAGVTSANAGSYTVVAWNTLGTIVSEAATLAVRESPVFTLHPASQTAAAASSVAFTATASGSPAPTYQWLYNGQPIAGSTSSSLTLTSITAADAASYSVVATNVAGSTTSQAAVLTVTPAPSAPPSSSPPQEAPVKPLVYMHFNLQGAPGVKTITVNGTAPRTMLIRAAGPSLRTFGISTVLENPVLELSQWGSLMMRNDNWQGSGMLNAAFARVGTFPFVSEHSTDAAMLITLDPGTYQIAISGIPASSGVTLLEVYEMP